MTKELTLQKLHLYCNIFDSTWKFSTVDRFLLNRTHSSSLTTGVTKFVWLETTGQTRLLYYVTIRHKNVSKRRMIRSNRMNYFLFQKSRQLEEYYKTQKLITKSSLFEKVLFRSTYKFEEVGFHLYQKMLDRSVSFGGRLRTINFF